MCFDALEVSQLIAGAHQIMFWIGGLVIDVAVEIVGKETHGLHHWKECDGKWQMIDFNWRKETAGRLQIAFGEGLEDVEAKVDAVNMRVILGNGIGSGAEEIAIV